MKHLKQDKFGPDLIEYALMVGVAVLLFGAISPSVAGIIATTIGGAPADSGAIRFVCGLFMVVFFGIIMFRRMKTPDDDQ